MELIYNVVKKGVLMDKKRKSVLVPILFFDYYNYSLELSEIKRYLWQENLSDAEIKEVLNNCKGIKHQHDLFGYKKVYDNREEKDKIARYLWGVVKKRRWVFSLVPFLSQVFVCNSMPSGNVHKNSDIDLFIVGENNHLWTLRAFLLVWLNLFGWRVRSLDKFAKFSPELFVSKNNLDLQPIQIENDYYLPWWIADLVSIWPDNQTNLIKEHNLWVKNNFPVAWDNPKVKNYRRLNVFGVTKLIEKILSGKLGERIEKIVKDRQLKIIEKTKERIGVNSVLQTKDNIIKLHFNDSRYQVRDYIDEELSKI